MRNERIVVCFLLFLFLLSSSALADNGNTIVHITKTGECYHRADCSYLRSDIEVTLKEAVDLGLRPCSGCRPPTLGDAEIENTNGTSVLNYVTNPESSLSTPVDRNSKSKSIETVGCAAATGLGGYLIGRKRKRE